MRMASRMASVLCGVASASLLALLGAPLGWCTGVCNARGWSASHAAGGQVLQRLAVIQHFGAQDMPACNVMTSHASAVRRALTAWMGTSPSHGFTWQAARWAGCRAPRMRLRLHSARLSSALGVRDGAAPTDSLGSGSTALGTRVPALVRAAVLATAAVVARLAAATAATTTPAALMMTAAAASTAAATVAAVVVAPVLHAHAAKGLHVDLALLREIHARLPLLRLHLGQPLRGLQAAQCSSETLLAGPRTQAPHPLLCP